MADPSDPSNCPCVLGIDAAWTTHNPSGVALAQRAAEGWQCLALAPSYDAFLAIAAGEPLDTSRKAQGSEPDPAALLAACQQLAGQPVDCVSVDMPLATTPITSRRAADTSIASRFGPKGCAVHSPSAERPGAIADQLRERFAELGVALHTTTTARKGPALIECYPHVALLALLKRDYRVPYKVSRSAQYWKAEQPPIAERFRRLLGEFTAIHQALSQRISAIPLTLPQPNEVTTLSSLKPMEDMLDALICAWIGIEHLDGRTVGLGDATAAIWLPAKLME
ncbi:conserved hypothetical protein DUF429 [Synechococcus sp. MEDNS5]|uniref:DUF429 domain-containing protein n=1 Tax=Synechococcus sp. MEDNS5 TaxID=1442554 RepID=UPI0016454D3A|nr:DUF429 domain-containing protein [Synechococcus sp. MEDNS5]QNJ05674.1 conserved hypothetical protein DUF429 [Synechococcus sp. MEDNS5]